MTDTTIIKQVERKVMERKNRMERKEREKEENETIRSLLFFIAYITQNHNNI